MVCRRYGAAAEEREREKELALIKQQYLGGDKQKKKMLRPSEKFKVSGLRAPGQVAARACMHV